MILLVRVYVQPGIIGAYPQVECFGHVLYDLVLSIENVDGKFWTSSFLFCCCYSFLLLTFFLFNTLLAWTLVKSVLLVMVCIVLRARHAVDEIDGNVFHFWSHVLLILSIIAVFYYFEAKVVVFPLCLLAYFFLEDFGGLGYYVHIARVDGCVK